MWAPEAENQGSEEESAREQGDPFPSLPLSLSDTAYGQTHFGPDRHNTNDRDSHVLLGAPYWVTQNIAAVAVMRSQMTQQCLTDEGVLVRCIQEVSALWGRLKEESQTMQGKQVALTRFLPTSSMFCWRTSLERADPDPESPLAELLAGLLRLAGGLPAPAPQN